MPARNWILSEIIRKSDLTKKLHFDWSLSLMCVFLHALETNLNQKQVSINRVCVYVCILVSFILRLSV